MIIRVFRRRIKLAGALAALVVMTPTAAYAQERPSAVVVAHAQIRQLAPVVNATGIVQSRAAADLAAAVAGRLEWVAEPGTVAEAG